MRRSAYPASRWVLPRGGGKCLYLCASNPFIFPPGGNAPPDVPLGLVLLQHPLYLEVQGPVEGGQAFTEVLMYGGFADAELPGGGPHRGTVLYDVKRQPAGAFLDVPFQAATLLHSFTGGRTPMPITSSRNAHKCS